MEPELDRWEEKFSLAIWITAIVCTLVMIPLGLFADPEAIAHLRMSSAAHTALH